MPLLASTVLLALQRFENSCACKFFSFVIIVFRAYENSKHKGMNYWNLIEPLYLNVAINLNDSHNPRFKPEEEFKYQVNILCSKVILSVSPDVVKDFF
jgi:hypothetical protein